MNETQKVHETAGFRRVLLVTDESGEGLAAARYADDLSRQFGGTAATLTITEAKARQRERQLSASAGSGRTVTTCTVSGPTVGARSHMLAEEVARAAEAFDADVIVLGLSRSRLARHRLAPSLRSLVAQATEVPALLAPASWGTDMDTPTDTDSTRSARVPDIDPLSAERTGTVQSGRYAGV